MKHKIDSRVQKQLDYMSQIVQIRRAGGYILAYLRKNGHTKKLELYWNKK